MLKICGIQQNSIADELGIRPGDVLQSINGNEVRDLIDYTYYMAEESLLMLFRAPDGDFEAEVEKKPYEDMGLEFENDGFGGKRVCGNKCLFCFVDQMPRGLRKTLYLKDDDWRMSFMMGSYITLTNLSEDEIDRIIEQRISPLYLSVHAADDTVRERLLGCPAARGSFSLLEKLVEHGIAVHTQVVLCPGINDGDVLTDTLERLYKLYPGVRSVAVVPVGLTKYRDGLFPLRVVDGETGKGVIRRVEALQARSLKENGTRFCFASDEMYIRAGLPLPDADSYEGFDQIENGVGMASKFAHEVRSALDNCDGVGAEQKRFGIVTAVDFYPFMEELAQLIRKRLDAEVRVYRVTNEFFGESVTVTGLLTGQDIIAQLGGKADVDVLLLSDSCFQEKNDIMLDDVSPDDLPERLGVADCRIVPVDGYEFVKQFMRTDSEVI